MRNLLAQVEGPIDTPDVDWFAVSPILVLIGGALVVLLVAGLARKTPTAVHTLITLASAGAALGISIVLWYDVHDPSEGPQTVLSGAVGVDGFSVFFTILVCVSVILATLLADGYIRREGIPGPELYVLMLLSASGGVIMASANDLIVLFLGLEILSIAVYVLAALQLRRIESQEAAMKYFVLGAFSSAFFLYGIALVYGATGSTRLLDIASFLAGNLLLENGVLLAGIALLLVGFGFKVAAVPFHAWTPDVYQGSPSPVVAFMASVVKAAGFAGLLRVLYLAFGTEQEDWQALIYALAVLTLVVGAVLAVVQRDVKRMLAYSSISHAGFVLVAVQSASDTGRSAALFYLLTYAVMVIGSFGVVTVVGRRGDANHDLDDYRGLGAQRPALALTFTVLLLSQAGVPLTSGFFGKFYVIGAAVDERSYPLAVVAMLSAVIAAFLYLRVIVAMYMSAPEGDEEAPAAEPAPVPLAAGLSLTVAVLFTLVVGFLPGLIQEFAEDAHLFV